MWWNSCDVSHDAIKSFSQRWLKIRQGWFQRSTLLDDLFMLIASFKFYFPCLAPKNHQLNTLNCHLNSRLIHINRLYHNAGVSVLVKGQTMHISKVHLLLMSLTCKYNGLHSLFILIMCIPSHRISNPRDFMNHIGGKMSLSWKELIAW